MILENKNELSEKKLDSKDGLKAIDAEVDKENGDFIISFNDNSRLVAKNNYNGGFSAHNFYKFSNTDNFSLYSFDGVLDAYVSSGSKDSFSPKGFWSDTLSQQEFAEYFNKTLSFLVPDKDFSKLNGTKDFMTRILFADLINLSTLDKLEENEMPNSDYIPSEALKDYVIKADFKKRDGIVYFKDGAKLIVSPKFEEGVFKPVDLESITLNINEQNNILEIANDPKYNGRNVNQEQFVNYLAAAKSFLKKRPSNNMVAKDILGVMDLYAKKAFEKIGAGYVNSPEKLSLVTK